MIGIIIADENEINKIRWNELDNRKEAGFNFKIYEFNNQKIVVAHSGIGVVKSAACAQQMIHSFGVKTIFNYGAVGADESHKVYDLVIPNKVYFHDVVTPWYPRGQVPGEVGFYINSWRNIPQYKNSNLATGMKFINNKEELSEIKKDLNIGIVDMETAGIMQIAFNNDVEVFIIKCVSDIIGRDSSSLGDINMRISEAGKRAFEEVIKKIEEKTAK